MKLNVVTIVYNDVNGIDLTLNSIMSNRQYIDKYIVIDGASKDGTLDVLKNRESEIDVLISEADSGIYDAMNKALKYCDKDSKILFLNSSDYFEPNILSVVKPKLMGGDITHGMINFVRGGEIIRSQGRHSSCLDSMMIEHPASFVHYNVFSELKGFNVKYKSAADYDFMLRAKSKKFTFCYLPIVITNFDMTGVSSTSINAAIESLKVRRLHGNLPWLRYYLLMTELKVKSFIKRLFL